MNSAEHCRQGASRSARSLPFRLHQLLLMHHASRITLCLLATSSLAADLDPAKLPPPSKTPVDFTRDVHPILEHSCLRCHGPERPKSRFRLDNRESALKGGENGVDIFPGDSARSPLIHYVARVVPDMEMPPPGKGDPLTAEQVGILRRWIDQGAEWGATNAEPHFNFSATPTLRFIHVNGDKQKFREIEGVREGWGGGAADFSFRQQLGSDTSLLLQGHALAPDTDVSVMMELRKRDLGFVRGGFEQWRRYYDDTGGYYGLYAMPAFSL